MWQHKWFKESKTSKDNEFRDYYMWRKPKYDEAGNRQPPNNWGAVWGGEHTSLQHHTYVTKFNCASR